MWYYLEDCLSQSRVHIKDTHTFHGLLARTPKQHKSIRVGQMEYSGTIPGLWHPVMVHELLAGELGHDVVHLGLAILDLEEALKRVLVKLELL